MKRLFLFVLLLLKWSLCPALPAQNALMFHRLGIREGLSNGQVNSVLEDSKGYIWLGTQSGLDRFDGFRFSNYFNKAGDERSLPNNVVADRDIKHKATFDGVGSNWKPQNKKNLRVVVMVIDNTTHNVVNGAHCPIKPYNTTGIATANATAQRVEVARFNLKGQRLSAPERGINIVKYSDGSVEKVSVR